MLLTTALCVSVGAQTSPEFERILPNINIRDLAVGPDGSIFLAGTTATPDLPVTGDAYDRTCGLDGRCDAGRSDGFLVILTPSGEISYATYFGGDASETDTQVAVSADGGVWLAGSTTSRQFSDQRDIAACDGSAMYLARLSRSRRSLDDFRCISGRAFDGVNDLAISRDGDIWLLGRTASPDFPTSDAWQPTFGGLSDIVLMKFAADRREPLLSTFLGGSDLDIGNALAMAPNGDAVITGYTSSRDFPLVRPLQSRFAGDTGSASDAVLVRLHSSGRHLEYSTFIGGSGPVFGCCGGQDVGHGVAVDRDGHAYVAGWTNASDFPVTAGTVDPQCGSDGACNSPLSDGFLLSADSDGALRFGSYLGASADDLALRIAVRADGSILVVGDTQSNDFPQVRAFAATWLPARATAVPFLVVTDPAASRYEQATYIPVRSARPLSMTAFVADEDYVYLAGAAAPAPTAPRGGAFIVKVRIGSGTR